MSVQTGEELFREEFTIDRDRLVRYAGASGDFNPIHYNDVFATEVGLPGVIAHGMCTMGLAATAVANWAGDPGAVTAISTRFSRPIEVPALGQTSIEVVGKAGPADGENLRVDLTVTHQGAAVLAKARATVRRAAGGAS